MGDDTATSFPELKALARRVGRLHLRQRLGIEGEAPVFGPGRTWFHPEHSPMAHHLLLAALRLLGLYGWGQRNAWDIRVRRNAVTLPGLPRSLDGLRLLHLTDLHLDSHPRFPELLAAAVAPLEYDLCVFTGDYRYRTFGPMEPALSGMEAVLGAIKGPTYAVLGNHDSLRMVPALERLGVRVLLNESEEIRPGFHLVGVDDPHYFRADNLEKACESLPEEAASVLLCHSPELYRQAAHCGLGLMLCGHTHGGQICLPGGWPLFTNADCPKPLARGGPWRHAELQGYTSVGAGSSVLDVRFNCPPEVVVHTLHSPD